MTKDFEIIKTFLSENKIDNEYLYNIRYEKNVLISNYTVNVKESGRTGEDLDEYEVILEFKNKDTNTITYIKFIGTYDSHTGVGFDDNEIYEVFKKERTVIYYE